jgi:type I restriction enzyme, S subunit
MKEMSKTLEYRKKKSTLPDGWRWSKLKDVGLFEAGGTPAKDRLEYWNGSIPFVTGADITQTYVTKDNARAFLTKSGLYSRKTVICKSGTVLIVARTRVGRCGIAQETMGASQDITAFSCGPQIDKDYLCGYLHSISKHLIDSCRGATIQGLTREFVEHLSIPLPSLTEQKRIAELLKEQMAAIEKARAAAQARLDAVKALPAAFLHEVLPQPGQILQDDWRWTRLREVAEVISGQHILECHYNMDGRGMGYLTGPADFGVVKPTITKWTEKPRVTCEPMDVLVTVKDAGVGKINLAPDSPVAIGRQLMAVRAHSGILDRLFLFRHLSTCLHHLQESAMGATVPGLSREHLQTLVIPLPPLKKQQYLAEILGERMTAAANAFVAVQEELNTINALPAALLRRAFNGEL